MKTLFFLNQRGYQAYDFDKIENLDQFRCVAVLNEKYFKLFPEDKKPVFDKIYEVPPLLQQGKPNYYYLDKEAVCAALEKEIALAGGAEHIRIVCIDEFGLVLAGELREKYGIPGAGRDLMLRYRDKSIMKNQLAKHGVSVPKHLLLNMAHNNLETYYSDIEATLGNGFIIKPIDGAGSENTNKISTLDEFRLFLSSHKNKPIQFEAEEFILGTLFHCECIIQNGKILFTVASEYNLPMMVYLEGKSVGAITLPDGKLKKRLCDFSKNALKILGLPNGITHMELFLTDTDEIVFLEVAARIPGAGTPRIQEKVFGYNLFNLDLNIQMENKLEMNHYHKKTNGFFLMCPPKIGRVKKLIAPNIKSQYEANWNVSVGDVFTKKPENILERVLMLLVTNPDYDQLRADFENLRYYSPLELEAFNE